MPYDGKAKPLFGPVDVGSRGHSERGDLSMAGVWHEDGHPLPLSHDELRNVGLSMLLARKAIRGTLPASLIHDIALEALLITYLSARNSASIEHLAVEIDAPLSLTKRWLSALSSEGLISATEHEVSLTGEGVISMGRMLTNVVMSQRKLLGWSGH